LAADFGVPQLRRRLFFIANKTGSDVPLPDPTHGDNSLWEDFALPFEHLSRVGNKNVTDGVKPHVGFEDACGDLPPLEPGETYEGPYPNEPETDYQRMMREGSDKLTMHTAHDSSDFVKKAIKHIGQDENWNALPEEMKKGTRYENIREYDATTVLKRIKPEDPSYTINTKFYDATAGAYIHPTEDRTYSLREAARLQSFKDSYLFKGSKAEIREQIGNAVPPLLAKKIAGAMLPYTSSPTEETDIDHMLADPDQSVNTLIGLKDDEDETDSGQNKELTEFS
jgi:DNA (cytosine-5)-methyltransferase 1